MKKLLSIAMAMALAILPFTSCQKSETVSEEEKLLQLQAPSGQHIAAAISDVRAEAAAIILDKFGTGKAFRLTAIEYLNVTKGYAAIISYRLSDGTTGNYATVADAAFTVEAASIRTNSVKTKKTSGASAIINDESVSKVTLQCLKTGTCECKISATINAETGTITWKCSCTDCEMQIIIS
ncbi:MAG TPA: hypothetical protein VD993_17630 [Chitinophagaceae bacterium]|nr:hypothetical protein [Chitinophagaceae bacterium]